jgi:hypothetical protein
MLLQKNLVTWLAVCLCVLALSACLSNVQPDASALVEPVDPYDYNYCGGVPVYPVIGVSFSTFCGPRNQLALGRYGTLMWLYPAPDGNTALYQGKRQLTVSELKHLSLLAEVVHLADPAVPQPGKVNYQLGINFPGRANQRLRGVADEHYTPALALLNALRQLAPGVPALPECEVQTGFFDPVQLPGKRQPLTLDDIISSQEYSHALK